MRVLVIEDFSTLREAIVQGLEEAGYAVDSSGNGEEGFYYAKSGEYDVIVLDLMIPQMDGLTLLKKLREMRCPSLVLVLTARDTPQDRVKGLDTGADDYLVKPFVFAEFLARVRALVRRKYQSNTPLVRVDDLEINTTTRQVWRAGKPIDLSAREYALLEYLAMNADRIVSRTDILQHVYDFNASLESNVIDVYVGILRKKLDVGGSARLIHTRRGQGYIMTQNREESV